MLVLPSRTAPAPLSCATTTASSLGMNSRKIFERTDVGDHERDAELILGADLAKVDAAVFEGDAAAVAVVTGLDDLVLQRLIGEVVADAGDEVETLSRFAAIPEERANLIRRRLLEGGHRRWGLDVADRGIIFQAKVGNVGEDFVVGLHFKEGAVGDDSLFMRILLQVLL